MQSVGPVGYVVFNLGGTRVITIQPLIGMMEDGWAKKAGHVTVYAFHPRDVFTKRGGRVQGRARLGWDRRWGLEEGGAAGGMVLARAAVGLMESRKKPLKLIKKLPVGSLFCHDTATYSALFFAGL
jgi:hypothetical protein